MGKQTYCKSGDKPTVIYSFNNKKEVRFKSRFSPIEVETKTTPVTADENYQAEGYLLSFYRLNGIGGDSAFVVDHRLFYAPPLIPSGLQNLLAIIRCGETNYSFRKDCGSYSQYSSCIESFPVDINSLKVDKTRKCPTPNKDKCSLQIYHKGIIIHSAQGDCPVNYEVKCGNCKDGEIECKTAHYPGYCCHDCQGKAEEIRRLREAVRRFGL